MNAQKLLVMEKPQAQATTLEKHLFTVRLDLLTLENLHCIEQHNVSEGVCQS